MVAISQYALGISFDGNAVKIKLKGGLDRGMYMFIFWKIRDAKKRVLGFGKLQRFMIVGDTIDPDEYWFFRWHALVAC